MIILKLLQLLMSFMPVLFIADHFSGGSWIICFIIIFALFFISNFIWFIGPIFFLLSAVFAFMDYGIKVGIIYSVIYIIVFALTVILKKDQG